MRDSSISSVALAVSIAVILSTVAIAGVVTGDQLEQNDKPPDDQFEPNDEYTEATQIDPGSYAELQISNSDDDWFTVDDVEVGDTISISASFDQPGDHQLTLSYPGSETGYIKRDSVSSESGSISVTKTIDRVDWEGNDLTDGSLYFHVTSDTSSVYTLDISLERSDSDEPTDQFEPNDEYTEATQIDPGSYSGLQISSSDTDWFTMDDVESGDTISISAEFDQPGDHRVTLNYPNAETGYIKRTSASSESGILSLSKTLDRVDWEGNDLSDNNIYFTVTSDTSSAYEFDTGVESEGHSLAPTIQELNNRTAGEAGFRLQTEYVDNVTVRVTDNNGQSVQSDHLTISAESQDFAVPLQHIEDGLYWADLKKRENSPGDRGPVVYTQQLRFDVAYADATEKVSTYAPVSTPHGLLNAPINGWVYNYNRYDVRVDGQRYITLEMRRDGAYEPDVSGEPEMAWLVFNSEGQLVQDSEIRRRAALAGYVAHVTRKESADDVTWYTETMPSQIDQFQQSAETLDTLQTVRDSIAGVGGTLAGAYATGGSNILSKQTGKAAAKALAKELAKNVLKDHLEKQVAADNPLDAIDTSMRLTSRIELRDAHNEFEEAGQMLDRHVGENNLNRWNYSDAKRYRQSITEAKTDGIYYTTLRYQMEQESLPDQFQSVATSFTSGATGAPIDLMVRLIQGGELGYVSTANEKTARMRALHELEQRSYQQYSKEAQQTGISLYDDRVLVGFDNAPTSTASLDISGIRSERTTAPANFTRIGDNGAGTVTVPFSSTLTSVGIDNVDDRGVLQTDPVAADNIPSPPGRSLSLINISAPDAGNSATLELSVDREALGQTNATALQISHYQDGTWERLDTAITSTEGSITLTAPVSDYSPFAVTVNQTTTETNTSIPPAEEEDDQSNTMDTDASGLGFDLAATALALLVMAVAVRYRNE